jgi:hypothetical protein
MIFGRPPAVYAVDVLRAGIELALGVVPLSRFSTARFTPYESDRISQRFAASRVAMPADSVPFRQNETRTRVLF